MLENGVIEQDHLLCDRSDPSATVYRAILSTAVLTKPMLSEIMQDIVARGVFMDNTTSATVDQTCPVVIRSFSDPICDSTADSVTDREESNSSNNGVAIALAGIGAVIALVAMVIVLVIAVMVYRRHKRRYENLNMYLYCAHANASCD